MLKLLTEWCRIQRLSSERAESEVEKRREKPASPSDKQDSNPGSNGEAAMGEKWQKTKERE